MSRTNKLMKMIRNKKEPAEDPEELKPPGRVLLAMDFDSTICDGNVDREVQRLFFIPNLSKHCRDRHWAEYMQVVYEHAFKESRRIKEHHIRRRICRLPLHQGMDTMIRYAGDLPHVDVIILSDSNTLFIQWILEHYNLAQCVDKIFSNPAQFTEEGKLELGLYGHFKCKMSNANLCKGKILKNYIREKKSEGTEFKRVIFVGDGKYDLCPAMKLRRRRDWLFARKNLRLHQMLKTRAVQGWFFKSVKSNIVTFEDATVVMPYLWYKPKPGDEMDFDHFLHGGGGISYNRPSTSSGEWQPPKPPGTEDPSDTDSGQGSGVESRPGTSGLAGVSGTTISQVTVHHSEKKEPTAAKPYFYSHHFRRPHRDDIIEEKLLPGEDSDDGIVRQCEPVQVHPGIFEEDPNESREFPFDLDEMFPTISPTLPEDAEPVELDETSPDKASLSPSS